MTALSSTALKGVILAGGKGTRLAPLTEVTNKHLLPVGREPMIWHAVRQLRSAGEKSKEHAVAEGITIARELLDRVRDSVQGVQVSAPFGKVELALEVFHDSLDPSSASAGATNAAVPAAVGS